MIGVLPGFMGREDDWKILPFPFRFIDLMKPDEWASTLPTVANQVAEHFRRDSVDTAIGYSLGGRVLFHILAQHPELLKRAFLVSAHPGLAPEERPGRRESDNVWSRRFLREEWVRLMEAWNEQPVFAKSEVARRECDYTRSRLSAILSEWSLGAQEDLRPSLGGVRAKVSVISGERDKKFVTIGSEVAAIFPGATHWICPEAGHRVPWDNTSAFVTFLQERLGSLG